LFVTRHAKADGGKGTRKTRVRLPKVKEEASKSKERIAKKGPERENFFHQNVGKLDERGGHIRSRGAIVPWSGNSIAEGEGQGTKG